MHPSVHMSILSECMVAELEATGSQLRYDKSYVRLSLSAGFLQVVFMYMVVLYECTVHRFMLYIHCVSLRAHACM